MKRHWDKIQDSVPEGFEPVKDLPLPPHSCQDDSSELAHTGWFCMYPSADPRLRERREKLRCKICNKDDSKSLRIAVQCNAGDDCEWEHFKPFHDYKNDPCLKGEGCWYAVHVGCARWEKTYDGRRDRNIRRCYYFPGRAPTYGGSSTFTEPVANVFCNKHAKEIQIGLDREKKAEERRQRGMSGGSPKRKIEGVCEPVDDGG